ncbi:MAG TPA: RHS repeat-associated core domain-containing protein [Pyrinomonadaceae bacterium]|nr:RHS repeat-associated core domain-containing protein [Pyrinomonadaceae bacterium]
MSLFNASNSGSTPDATYSYDGSGLRVKKETASETTIFVYDASSKVVAEYSTALASTPQVSYLTTDHLGSPRVTTNELAVVTNRKDFAAFGDEVASSERVSGNKYVSTPDEVRQDYTGYEKDEESGLEFAQARYYAPIHGRFTSVDPMTASATIRDPQSFNRYSYGLNSPYKFTDPLGLLSEYTSGACGNRCANSDPNGGGGYTGYYYSGQLNGWQQALVDDYAQRFGMSALQEIAPGVRPSQKPPTVQDKILANVVRTLTVIAARYLAQSSPYLAIAMVGDSSLGYVAGSQTPTYNCFAWAVGITNRWIQTGVGGDTKEENTGPIISLQISSANQEEKREILAEGIFTPETALNHFASKWDFRWTPAGFYRIRVYLNSSFPRDWHVMRQDRDGTWSSKNGPSYLFRGIQDPDLFYRLTFHHVGRIQTIDYIRFGGTQ